MSALLYVDPFEFFRDFFDDFGSIFNCETITAKCGIDALEILKTKHIDLVFSEIHMQNGDGIWLLNSIKTLKYRPIFAFISYQIHNKNELIEFGANQCFEKNDRKELEHLIDFVQMWFSIKTLV